MSDRLWGMKQRAIPSSAEAQARKQGYRQGVTITTDAPLEQEPCVEARTIEVCGANHYNDPHNPPYYMRIPGSIPELFVRRSVGERLREVNASLKPLGLELWLFDAWRPQAVQRYFHDVWFPDWLKQRLPHLEGQALANAVETYWSAPTASAASPSPHSTGGAVDLTLRFTGSGQHLFMGGLFDDATEDAWSDAYERMPIVSMSDAEAQANRRLLYWAMTEAGFANNPTEWWHYSWGDQMWARLTGRAFAHYGACNPTSAPDA